MPRTHSIGRTQAFLRCALGGCAALGLLGGSATASAQMEPPAIRGAVEVSIANFDLSSPDAQWNRSDAAPDSGWGLRFVEATDDERAHWQFEAPLVGWDNNTRWSSAKVELEPNTPYRLSALIKTDFDQMANEVNIGWMTRDAEGTYINGSNDAAVPAMTSSPSGWTWWHHEFTFPAADRIVAGQPGITLYVGDINQRPVEVRIADMKLEKLPTQPQGVADDQDALDLVTFRGGPGALPLAVESHSIQDDRQVVEVSGVRWTLNARTGELLAEQRIDLPRELARFNIDADLHNLEVLRSDATVLVLANDHVALGFQCDGMLAVAPLRRGLSLDVTSRIDAPFVRMGDGAVFATDGYGGFTAAHYPQRQTGRLAQIQAVGPTPDFATLHWKDTSTLSREPAGWTVRLPDVRPGDRALLSAFPPRDFDWAQSFESRWTLTWKSWTVDDLADPDFDRINTFLMWDQHWREWGMTFSDDFVPFDPFQIDAHVRTGKDLGKDTIFYTSAWFHRTRDADVYRDAVMKVIDTHDMAGFYTDGLPAVDWLLGYEQMRMMREQLGDGMILVHDSVPQSGRHVATLAPWIYTYATTTYMAEHLDSGEAGPDWPWVRYVLKMHRLANAVGALKADAWNADEFDDATDKYRAALLWNARGGSDHYQGNDGQYLAEYLPQEDRLKQLWQRHGDEPFFYDRRWLPAARQATGFRYGPAGMPTITRLPDGRVRLTSYEPDATLRYTLDGTPPTADSSTYTEPFEAPADAVIHAVTLAEDLEPSLIATTDPDQPALAPPMPLLLSTKNGTR